MDDGNANRKAELALHRIDNLKSDMDRLQSELTETMNQLSGLVNITRNMSIAMGNMVNDLRILVEDYKSRQNRIITLDKVAMN